MIEFGYKPDRSQDDQATGLEPAPGG